MKESLFVEDLTTLKASSSGPMWRVASIVEDYYSPAFRRGLDGLNRALAVLLDGNADYSETGYEFRNGLECAAWLIRAQDRNYDFSGVSPKDNKVIDNAIERVSMFIAEDLCRDHYMSRILLVWRWDDFEHGRFNVAAATGDQILSLCKTLIKFDLEEQLSQTADWVEKEIEGKRIENEEERKRNWEYEEDDFDMLELLKAIHGYLETNGREDEASEMLPALKFVERFMDNALTDDDECESFGFYVYEDNSCGFDSVSFDISSEELSMDSGGSFVSEVGSDSFGDRVWTLERYSHAHSKGSAWAALSMIKHGCSLSKC